jgi:hypothetical protein
MATNAQWTVVFEDKCIIKNNGAEAGTGYIIDDNAFWATTAFQNIWAIQSGTSNSSDEVEHKDGTAHCSLADEGIDISQFITRWDAAHLTQLQSNWDTNNIKIEDPADSETYRDETEAEKISRLGARPTSYSS